MVRAIRHATVQTGMDRYDTADKPIIFSTPMIRSILAGQKTQTRRVEKKGTPRYSVGDLLWVRETWDLMPMNSSPNTDGTSQWEIFYEADGDRRILKAPPGFNPMLYNYERRRPSIHMPRWASRITLEVIDVRQEHLQDISEEDAKAEGVGSVEEYRQLWDSLNAKRKDNLAKRVYGWKDNPSVRVTEFKPVPCTRLEVE